MMRESTDLFDYDAELRRHNEHFRAAARVGPGGTARPAPSSTTWSPGGSGGVREDLVRVVDATPVPKFKVG